MSSLFKVGLMFFIVGMYTSEKQVVAILFGEGSHQRKAPPLDSVVWMTDNALT
jgi:hypothetical protein